MRVVSSSGFLEKSVIRKALSAYWLCILLMLCVFHLPILHAQVIFTAGAGLTQSENFTSLGVASGVVASTLPNGWRVAGNGATGNYDGTATNMTARGAGTTGAGVLNGISAGALYNLADGVAGTSTERAPGFLPSGASTPPHYLFVETQNNSAQGITQLQIAYNIERYRSGQRDATIELFTSTDGTTWVLHAGATETLAGEANNTTVSNPPGQIAKNFTVTGLAVPIGGMLYVRWRYSDGGAGGRKALGIDDVVLTATNGALPASSAYSGIDFPENAVNNGTITQIRTITLTNAQWLNSIINGTLLTPTTHFTTANVPPGMTLTVTKNTNMQVTVALTGSATNHAAAHNINNLTLTFQDAVIEGATHLASAIPGLNRNNLTVSFLNPPSRIRAIQGVQHSSPLVGQLVNAVPGIVTAVRDNGFFMQDPTDDGDIRTSEGMFVFTGAAPPVTITVGDSVHISGTVIEFRTSNPDGLTLTEIGNPSLVIAEQTLPTMTITPTLIGSGGRVIPTNIISDDASGGDAENIATLFDPANDGLDFYESVENMLVQVNDALVVEPGGSPMAIVTDNGTNATGRTTRGGLAVSANDDNPERLYIIRNDNTLATPGNRQVGDRYPGAIIGVIEYTSDKYRLRYTQNLPTLVPSVLTPEVTALTGDANRLTVATYNAHNMTPTSTHIPGFAAHIVSNLRSPDIIGAVEIQDNSGATNNGIVDATSTLNALVTAIQGAGGPRYAYRQINPNNNDEGGQPGGNIRVALLFDSTRVQFIDRGIPGASIPAIIGTDANGKAQISVSPGRIDPTNLAWTNTRRPLVGEFMFNGNKVFVVVAHLSSKIGDGPSFGRNQPPILTTEARRIQQGAVINTFVSNLVSTDPTANVVVVGDMNEHEFRPALTTMEGAVLYNLMRNIPINDRYTYNFEGNSQVLDNILVSQRLQNFYKSEIDIVHLNADLHESNQLTDHEAVVARIDFTPPTVPPPPSTSIVGNVATTGPRIDSFSPQYGLRGTVVTILGTGFTGAISVSFGGTSALSFQIISDNLIYATVSGGSSGVVAVVTPQNTLSLQGFIFGTPPLPPPTITLMPSSVTPGDTITITGQLFEQVSGVRLAGQPMNFTLVNGQLRVIIGAVPLGTQLLQLRTTSGIAIGSTIVVNELPEARIFNLSPSIVQANDQAVRINAEGIHLQRIQSFYVTEGTSATINYRAGLTSVAAGILSFMLPPELQMGGIKKIHFVNADGAVTSATLTVMAAPAPRFEASVVSTSANSSAFILRLRGTGFMRNARILLNGSTPLYAFVESTTALIVAVPRELNTFMGTHSIRIINLDKQSTETTLHIKRGNLPYISNINIRLSDEEYSLTIAGANFHRNILGLLNTAPLRILSADSIRISAQISLSAWQKIKTQNVLLYLVNPNNTSIGLWLNESLFDKARIESLATVDFTGVRGEGTHSLVVAENIEHPSYLTVVEQITPNIDKVVHVAKKALKDDLHRSEITVQPNPSNDNIVLTFPKFSQPTKNIFVTNQRGEKVLEATISSSYKYATEQAVSMLSLDIQSLPTGTYFIYCMGTDNKMYSGKFVIIR